MLRGRLRPLEERLVQHPLTEEKCLYYAGADRHHPHQQFYLNDDTGQILVNPQGAVLLSADGVLEADEEVLVLGHVSRLRGSEKGGVGGKVIGKNQESRTLFSRIGHFLVQGVLGLWKRGGTGMALFSDPQRCFWIWDDYDRRPLGAWYELLRLLAVFLFAGFWITVFAAAALAVFDDEFSQTLLVWLNL